MTLRLQADAVFTVDSADTVLAPGAVEIEDGLISWIGDPWEVPASSGTDVRQLGGILMPGLVNCHGHTPMTLLRSAGDGLPLDRWLHESIWPREARLEDEDVYWGMLLGATELLSNGVTTTCEQYRHPSAVVEAVVEAGIRTVYTPAIFDVPDAGPNNTWEALLEAACQLVDAVAGKHENLQMGFGPHAAYTVPPEGIRTIAAEARARDALLQIHLSETAAECQVVLDRYGMSAPALLASEGVLEGRVLAAPRFGSTMPTSRCLPSTMSPWLTAQARMASSDRASPHYGRCSTAGCGWASVRTVRHPMMIFILGMSSDWPPPSPVPSPVIRMP